MRRLALMLALILFNGSVWAMHCPQEMARIDSLLQSDPPDDPEVRAEVERLRNEGEQLHKSGNHEESVKVLEEALNLLQASE